MSQPWHWDEPKMSYSRKLSYIEAWYWWLLFDVQITTCKCCLHFLSRRRMFFFCNCGWFCLLLYELMLQKQGMVITIHAVIFLHLNRKNPVMCSSCPLLQMKRGASYAPPVALSSQFPLVVWLNSRCAQKLHRFKCWCIYIYIYTESDFRLMRIW